MSYKRYKREIKFPSKIVGWLNIWDVHGDCIQRYLTEGREPWPKFEPYFCILRQDLKTLQCHRSEENAEDLPGLVRLPVVRLDEGKRQFDRRWGYETLECIKENSIQHFSMLSTERLYKTQQDVPSFNESLPDLTRSYDSAIFPPKRRHMLKKFFHTSYEKLVGEKDMRRGSVPAVPAAVCEDSVTMDTHMATPSRFTNFLIRKGFKTNLKRAKSANKLERKQRSVTPTPEQDSTFVGTLKRTMSLGRLTRKRTRTKSSDIVTHKLHEHGQDQLSVISSRLKNSQSHESLLTTHSPLHSIDLTSPDMEIRSVHSSIMSEEHCFQVSTMHGSKYISCRSAEERDQWMTNLRKTANPQHENSRRSESSLKVWVQEAKNVPVKKRYFCEVCLDKHLYARTSIKTKGDMLFWGEQFEFNNLPSVEFLIVNLYREADKKKKKDRNTLIGYSKIAISDISNRQYVERWFATSSGTVGKGGKEIKTDLPLIRLKVRHQTVQILPIDMYKDLSKYLKENYGMLCDVLEPLVNIKDKEEIATTLINIMQKLDKSRDFLSEVVMAEVLRLDNNHLTFRGNSIATKAMEAHMKLVGEKYLNDTLGDFVRTIIETEDDCEVDPTRVPIPSLLTRNQTNLRMYCDMAWTKIITSSSFFPSELRGVFTKFRSCCEKEGKGDLSDNLISASIFLRFLCPAILSPSLFHLTQEFPSEKAARTLTLIAKTIQTLANFSKFGGKEEYMTFMNDFVEEEWCNMKDFLHKISSADQNDNYTEYDGFIDLGKELSILHTVLTDTLEKTSEDMMEKLGTLPKILSQITEDLKDPNITQRRQINRKSQHYDNLVNIQAHIDHTTSPTELLRDMLRQCGESPSQLPIFSNGDSKNSSSPRGSIDNMTSSDSNLTEDSASEKVDFASSEVSNVSVSSRSKVSESRVNKTWSEIVSAAEIVNGDYIDLISFMDEEGNNSSMELEHNGSQMSISQNSTIASSGYQSFGYSQSSSPIDNAQQQENSHESVRSPNNNTYPHSTPLSFANPMYRHTHRGISSHHKISSPILQASSNSSLSSEEAHTVKNYRSDKFDSDRRKDSLSKTLNSPMSSSSSSEVVTDRDKVPHSLSNNNMCSSVYSSELRHGPTHSKSNNNVYSLNVELNTKPRHSQSNNNISARSIETTFTNNISSSSRRKVPLDLRTSSPILSHKVTTSSSTVAANTTYYNTIGSTPRRGHELSQSVDFSNMGQSRDRMRRTATDSLLSQRSGSPYSENSASAASSPVSPRGAVSPEDSSLFRRLSAQNAVHMGIRSVQRRINEQEKTKQEYESEVSVLKQQLEEAQQRLRMAEERLHDHESETSKIASEWQVRLEESEERMRKQQAEKDGQMKNIIQRLIHVEDELRHEQEEMQITVAQKQKVIEAQERRIQSLDVANNKLVLALNQLKEHYNATAINGLTVPLKTKLATDISSFKTSSC